MTAQTDTGQDEQERLHQERREQAVSRYLLPLLHLLEDFAIAEGLDCRPFGPQCYWNGTVHHWSLVYDMDDKGQMLAYVDIALDLSDLEAMRLRVMACAEVSEGNAEQLATAVGSLTGIAVAPSGASAEGVSG